jgi:hypothetical protein
MWWFNNKAVSNDVKSSTIITNEDKNIDNFSNNSNDNTKSNKVDEQPKKSTKFIGYVLKTFLNIDHVDTKPIIPPITSPTVPSSSSKTTTTTTTTIENNGSMSTGWFFAMSLASLSGGMLYGVHTVVKRENTKLSDVIKANSTAFSAASRALLYGTILCCGAFLGSGAIFISLTGITTFQELGESSRRNFQRIDDTTKQRQRIAAEKKIMQLYNETQEMDYWKNLYEKNFNKSESKVDNKK